MKPSSKQRFAASVLAVAAGLSLMALTAEETRPAATHAADLSRAAEEMALAAAAFWSSLTPDQQAKTGFEIKDEERLNWHFIPKERKGLTIKDMTSAQRQLAYALLSTGLSQQGYAKAVTIMSLEQVLADMEGANRKFPRDPELYHFSIFGKPDPKGTWGWRVEGHHISLNFIVVGGKAIASAPAFLGSNPGLVKDGPRKGLRVLGNDEEMARQLVKSLNPDQKHAALFAEKAPADILLVPQKKIVQLEPSGIAFSRLTPPQTDVLQRLVKEYAHRLRPELAEQDLAKIEKSGWDKVHFAWAGGLEAGEGHYYRVQGPTFVIEYDNTQNGANHVHSVWHDPESNFGADLLKRHYEQDHKK